MEIKAVQSRGFSMEQLYALINQSRQNLSQGEKRTRDRIELLKAVEQIVLKHRVIHKKAGSRIIYFSMKVKDQLGIGINTFEQMVKECGLGIKRARSWLRTSDRCSKSKEYCNLINGLVLDGPNQLIVCDLTYVVAPNRYYVFAIKDVYTGLLVGLWGCTRMTVEVAITALLQLFELRGPGPFVYLIHHTDGGSQYFADKYLQILKAMGIRSSVANTCLENGYAEQVNHIIKNNYLRYLDLGNVKAFQKSLLRTKEIYNNERIQKGLGYRTPVEYEKYIMSLDKDQRPQMRLYDFNNN
jgi:hypothetical protein